MRIGILPGDYSPADGGAFTIQGELLQAISRLRTETQHQFSLLSPAKHAHHFSEFVPGLPVISTPKPGLIELIRLRAQRGLTGLRGKRWSFSSMERTARAAGIEFLLFLSPRPEDIDLPFIVPVYDLQHRLQPYFPEVSAHGEWIIREQALGRFLPRAAGIISGTQAGKAELERFFKIVPERIHILPHPTPGYALKAERQPRETLDRFNLPDRYLFYPAQFWAHKNHANLLYSLKELREKNGLTPVLALTGSDWGNQTYIERLTKELGLEDQVRFLGFVSQQELTALYQHAAALTYLTYFGPENLPPLEAMALGCPVLASNVSGAEEQLGDNALLVSPSDPSGIAVGIRRILQDTDLREELITKGKAHAGRWTTDDFVRGVFKILDDFEPIRRTWA